MTDTHLQINRQTLQRFILGRQGLWPGRRWRGQAGLLQALQEDCVIQIDPLKVHARSHDLALFGRILDYQPAHLETALYQERRGFDYGGTLFVYPMEELPYWRVVMARKTQEARWKAFAKAHAEVMQNVLETIAKQGPLGNRDFSGEKISTGNYRSNKDSGQALYYLWISGELMTHSRRNFQRLYDLRQRVAPPPLQHSADEEEADAFFHLKALRQLGLATLKSWQNWSSGLSERKVSQEEALSRLQTLARGGQLAVVTLEDDSREPRYLLAQDLPLLEALHAGTIPPAWQPLESNTCQEVTFLAPLEITSARGRAKKLFYFDYVWEVYKPAEQRRWGYYTLPVLYGNCLVARFDAQMDRSQSALIIKGFWLEADTVLDEPFRQALLAGFRRFAAFVGAKRIVCGESVTNEICELLTNL